MSGRCAICYELVGDGFDAMHEHMYGDNPYARNCQEISGNKLEAHYHNDNSLNWLEKLVRSFKKPKLERTAHLELLDYKLRLNSAMTDSNYKGDFSEFK